MKSNIVVKGLFIVAQILLFGTAGGCGNPPKEASEPSFENRGNQSSDQPSGPANSSNQGPKPSRNPQVTEVEIPVVLNEDGKSPEQAYLVSWTSLLNSRLAAQSLNYKITLKISEPGAIDATSPVVFFAMTASTPRYSGKRKTDKFDKILGSKNRILTLVFLWQNEIGDITPEPNGFLAFSAGLGTPEQNKVHFTDQNNIRILPKNRLDGHFEVGDIEANLTLLEERFVITKSIFNRVFD